MTLPGGLAGALRRVRAIPRTHVIVVVVALAYAVFLSVLSVQSHRGLKTVMNDMGNADQALWGAAHGDLRMRQSNDVDGQLRSRFGIHANFIFLPLSLIYRLRPDPEILLVITSLACAAAGIGIYAFARARLKRDGWAAVAALAFLASPMVHDANLFDFHVVTLIAALLVWATWAFETRRRLAGFLLLGLALLCKEDVALIVVMLGAYLALSGSRRLGLAVSALGALYFAVVTKLVVPAITGGAGLDTLNGSASRYLWLGKSPGEMVVNAIRDPALLIGHVNQPDKLRILVYLLLSGGIVALRAYPMLLVLLPSLAMGLLGTSWMTRVTGTYYWMVSETVVVMACVLAAERRLRAGRSPYPLVYLAIATASFCLLLTPLPFGLNSSLANFAVPPERPALEEIRGFLPPDASISVQNNLGPQLSQRGDVASYPRRSDSAVYALFHLRHVGGPDAGLAFRSSPYALYQLSPRKLVGAARKLIASKDWGLIAHGDGYYLFEWDVDRTLSIDARQEFDEDARLFLAQCEEATSHNQPWARYLVGRYGWWIVLQRLHLAPENEADPWREWGELDDWARHTPPQSEEQQPPGAR